MKTRRALAVSLTALSLALSLVGGVTASAAERDRDGQRAALATTAAIIRPVAVPAVTTAPVLVDLGTQPTGPDARS